MVIRQNVLKHVQWMIALPLDKLYQIELAKDANLEILIISCMKAGVNVVDLEGKNLLGYMDKNSKNKLGKIKGIKSIKLIL